MTNSSDTNRTPSMDGLVDLNGDRYPNEGSAMKAVSETMSWTGGDINAIQNGDTEVHTSAARIAPADDTTEVPRATVTKELAEPVSTGGGEAPVPTSAVLAKRAHSPEAAPADGVVTSDNPTGPDNTEAVAVGRASASKTASKPVSGGRGEDHVKQIGDAEVPISAATINGTTTSAIESDKADDSTEVPPHAIATEPVLTRNGGEPQVPTSEGTSLLYSISQYSVWVDIVDVQRW
ncbi:hypothetical protein FA95DRAFT_1607962 [Auriscalpium vulgare]|uniref:Uncharacterized protein n=1 Tax=Auriscalpium vulgare TaxID=40419 RepID=A0ACB8RMY8_9AGAM|nr:hypothetical protein FA95DRAFT_1607962 [Auriscalpium vulgare]